MTDNTAKTNEPSIDFRALREETQRGIFEEKTGGMTGSDTIQMESRIFREGTPPRVASVHNIVSEKSANNTDQVSAGAYVGLPRSEALVEEMSHLRNSVRSQRRQALLAAQQRVEKFETLLQEVTAHHTIAVDESEAKHNAEIQSIQENIEHTRRMLEHYNSLLLQQKQEKAADRERLVEVYEDQMEDISAMLDAEQQVVTRLSRKAADEAKMNVLTTLEEQGLPIPDSVASAQVKRNRVTTEQPKDYLLAT